eukprot:6219714-Karenia_brevis.AAC.1
MEFRKVDGKSNPADLMTKHLAQADLHKYFEYLNLSKENERPKAAAELSQVEKKKEETVKSSNEARYPSTWGAFMVHAGGNASTPWRWHS